MSNNVADTEPDRGQGLRVEVFTSAASPRNDVSFVDRFARMPWRNEEQAGSEVTGSKVTSRRRKREKISLIGRALR